MYLPGIMEGIAFHLLDNLVVEFFSLYLKLEDLLIQLTFQILR